MHTILTVNPGSTTTKIAAYRDETPLFTETVEHRPEELAGKRIMEQFGLRRETLARCLDTHGLRPSELSAVAARGGKLPPLRRGAYRVNALMVETLRKHPVDEHASNLGAVLAYDLAEPLDIPAYIYDAVVTDEMDDVARFSGVPELPRRASCHVLNMYAAARKYAERTSRPPEETTVVIMHMGGGISGCALLQGRMIDVLSDEEGPFSPERAGRVPCRQLVNLCFSGRLDHSAATRRMRGNGGLRAYLGTGSVLEVERRIAAGDAYAAQVYEAMAYQVAKGIGELATVLPGGPEAIILTGAIARSQTFTQLITNRVRFLAQVVIIPGENEMEALALGVLRVLRGEEPSREFRLAPPEGNPTWTDIPSGVAAFCF
ncbi:butyrate kinase [Bilophila wadsworthia]